MSVIFVKVLQLHILRQFLTYILLFNLLAAVGQCPNITISSSQNTYCLSDFVQLSASNVPAGATLEWNVGNGWNSGSSNYAVQPANAGSLNVDLRVTLSSGTICNYNASALATVNDIPAVDLKLSRTLVCEGLDTLTLTDLSPTSVNRTWVIGTSNYTDVTKTQIVSLKELGVHDVKLIVQDANGCRNSKTINNHVNVYEDIDLDFTKSNIGSCAPIVTNLTSFYNLGNQSISSVQWNLPGSNNINPTTNNVSGVTYNTFGRHRVTLTIETQSGCTYVHSKNNYISIGESANLAITASKSEVCLSEPVSLTQTNQPLPGSIFWDINSHSVDRISKYKSTFVFKDTGYYDVTLTYDHFNCKTILNVNDVIRVVGLKASFESNNSFHCEAPHLVNITNISDTTSTPILGFKWNIFDALTDTLVVTDTTKHINFNIQNDSAFYDVQLIADAVNGCSDTTTLEDFMYVAPYDFDYGASPDIGCVGQEFQITNNTESPSYYGFDFYSWKFLDKDTTTVLKTTSSLSPKIIYLDTGKYHIEVTGANPLGCQDIDTALNIIEIVLPVLDFSIGDSVICKEDLALFTGNSTPINSKFKHNYRLVHRTSGQSFKTSGITANSSVGPVGVYDVYYNYVISPSCNDTIQKALYVNGLSGTIELDSTSGCPQMITKPRFKKDYNIHFGSQDTSLQYFWDVTPSSGAIVLGATTKNPEFRFLESKNYKITLYVSNSTGCGFYVESDVIKTGVLSDFTLNRTLSCVGDTFVAINITDNNPSLIKWEVEPAAKATVDSINPNEIRIIPNDTGFIDIKLITGKNNYCFDTLTRTIEVSNLAADFSISDTNVYCAPSTVTFTNLSLNADTLHWFFGDQNQLKTTNDTSATHTYSLNSDSTGYDVSLIAISSYGCRDTITKRGAVKVNGPIANFDVSAKIGCEPFVVSFTNLSKFYDSTIIFYGFGFKPDTNEFSTHTYYNTSDKLLQNYTPILTVIDSTGCRATFVGPTVKPANVPESAISLDPDTSICRGESIFCSDTGLYGTTWKWYVENNLVATRKSENIEFNQYGSNELVLISENQYGCKDTTKRTITVLESPDFVFDAPQFLCANKPLNIEVLVDTPPHPLNYIWDFGEPSNPDNNQTTIGNSAVITYATSGTKRIKAQASLSNGCSVPDSIEIEIFDPVNIPVVKLEMVSFNDQNQVFIQHEDVVFDYLKNFNILRDNIAIKQQDLNADRRLIDSFPITSQKSCYNISVIDQCDNEGLSDRDHCPVILNLNNGGSKNIELNWSYYIGWDLVDKYEIYRKAPGENFIKIGEVLNTARSFTDTSSLCNFEFSYKIAALKSGEDLVSYSNIETTVPFYITNDIPNEITVVSVSNNDIEVLWTPSSFAGHEKYKLFKYENSLNNLVDSFETTNTQYLDNNVDIDNNNYFYRLQDIDQCQNATDAINYGNSILLVAKTDQFTSTLNWNKYEDWVPAYTNNIVEYIGPNGPEQLTQLGPNQLTFKDQEIHEDIDGYYTYRVYALNEAGDKSYSNIVKTQGTSVHHIPTAFSPNADGTNDEFKYFTLFISNDVDNNDFEISIYNRWGSKVFGSNNVTEYWDGNSNGNPQPQGVYLYQIKITDNAGRIYNHSGLLHLLR